MRIRIVVLFALFMSYGFVGNNKTFKVTYGEKKYMKKDTSIHLADVYVLKNNLVDGTYEVYKKIGKKKHLVEKAVYKWNVRNGVCFSYNHNPFTYWEVKYVDGKKDGFSNAYYVIDNDTLLVEASTYRKNELQGQSFIYEVTDEKKRYLQSVRKYQDGKPDGKWVSLSETGDTLSTKCYDQGVLIRCSD